MLAYAGSFLFGSLGCMKKKRAGLASLAPHAAVASFYLACISCPSPIRSPHHGPHMALDKSALTTRTASSLLDPVRIKMSSSPSSTPTSAQNSRQPVENRR